MFKIEIITKRKIENFRGRCVLFNIHGIGVKSITKVDYSSLYFIDGNINIREIKKIASELLVDKIIEHYVISLCNTKCDTKVVSKSYIKNDNSDLNVSIVEVLYKDGVTDAASESVLKAIQDLGIVKKIEVKTGDKYYLYGNGISQNTLNVVIDKLLVNTLIQKYEINKFK
jgi:phosphoribosylformylglycinamidine (FGAM) synthase PurS component